jgi:RNA polymerase sigma-70 factor (ECF subfamily)
MVAAQQTADGSWVRAAVSRFEAALTLYAARLLGDSDRARDVVQDTFLRLCVQNPAEVDPHLAEWLFTVCRNRSLDVLKKERRMTRLSEDQVRLRPSAEPEPADLAEHRDSAARAIDLVDALPPNQREVIRLKFQNGFSYREISRISGHSVTNVGYLIHTGLKTIRSQMVEGRAAGALPLKEGRP